VSLGTSEKSRSCRSHGRCGVTRTTQQQQQQQWKRPDSQRPIHSNAQDRRDVCGRSERRRVVARSSLAPRPSPPPSSALPAGRGAHRVCSDDVVTWSTESHQRQVAGCASILVGRLSRRLRHVSCQQRQSASPVSLLPEEGGLLVLCFISCTVVFCLVSPLTDSVTFSELFRFILIFVGLLSVDRYNIRYRTCCE